MSVKRKSSLKKEEGPGPIANIVFVGSVLVVVLVMGCFKGSYDLIKGAGKITVKGSRMMLFL